MKLNFPTRSGLIIAFSCLFLTLPARAADWGPLVGKLLEHLAEHTGLSVAERIVERATRGQPLPDLTVTDTQLRQAALQQVARCIARAKWLDDNTPEIGALIQGTPSRIPFGYESELKAFHENCDSVLPQK